MSKQHLFLYFELTKLINLFMRKKTVSTIAPETVISSFIQLLLKFK